MSKKSADKSETKCKQAELELAKLKYETDQLAYQNTNVYRSLEIAKGCFGAGGVIIGVASLITIAISFFQWVETTEQAQVARLEERLSKIMIDLTDTSKQVRLSGIISYRPIQS